jgi:hypothetical protein
MDFLTYIENKNVAFLLSCVLGFGMAALLRPMCKGPDCVILRGPPISQVRNAVYQTGSKCHEFEAKVVKCPVDENTKVVDTFSFADTT